MYPPVLVSLGWNSSAQTIVKVKNCEPRKDATFIHFFEKVSFDAAETVSCVPFLMYLHFLCTFLQRLFLNHILFTDP